MIEDKNTYQLIDELHLEMEKYKNWHPHFVSLGKWRVMKMEMATNSLSKNGFEQLSQAVHNANLAIGNFAKTLAGVFIND